MVRYRLPESQGPIAFHNAQMIPDVHRHAGSTAILQSTSPVVLVCISILGIQLGAAFAVTLFPALGAEGVVALRVLLAAIFIGMTVYRRVPELIRVVRENFMLTSLFGTSMAAMNLFFYMALDRIPLGAVVAIEFCGPLGVAVYNAKRPHHVIWVLLALVGVFLLSPFSGADLNLSGIVFAMLAGLGWALFIILAGRLNKRIEGHDGLIVGMVIAGFCLFPLAVPVIPTVVASLDLLLWVVLVALLSTAIPFTLEYEALKRIPPRVYGVLVSLEPAVALMVGALILHERIAFQGVVAVACVVVAAIGITVTDRRDRDVPVIEDNERIQ